MFSQMRKDPRSFLLTLLLVVAIVAPISAIASFGVAHYRESHRQVGVGQSATDSNPDKAGDSQSTSSPTSQSSDPSTLNSDEGNGYQDHQGNALENSNEKHEVVFRQEGSDIKPLIAIVIAILAASSLAYLIGFRSARKRHN